MASQIVKTHSVNYELLKTAVHSSDIVLVTGLPSTGKTTLTKKVLDEYQRCIYAYVNCDSIVEPFQLYIYICQSLQDKLVMRQSVLKLPSQVSGIPGVEEYLNRFHKLAASRGKEKVFVILDQIEVFRNTAMESCLTVLATIEHINLVLATNTTPSDILEMIDCPAIRLSIQDRIKSSVIHLTPWSKEDLEEKIMEQPPIKYARLYQKFVHNIVSVLYSNTTRDFIQLRSFCQENFRKFLDCHKTKATELMIKNRLDPEDFSDDEESYTVNVKTFLQTFKEFKLDIEAEEKVCGVDQKLVIGTGILLIAAYVAAHTRPENDKRTFVKLQKKDHKKPRSGHRLIDDSTKVFTLERLIQIYQILLRNSFYNKEKTAVKLPEIEAKDLPDIFLSDIQHLEDLKILNIVTGDGLSPITTYQLSDEVPREFIDRLVIHYLPFKPEDLYGFS